MVNNISAKGTQQLTCETKINDLLANNGGLITTAEIAGEGISKPSFYEYVRKENLVNFPGAEPAGYSA